MRLIGTVNNESEARRFTAYLKRRGIESSVDPSLDVASNQFLYSIWIHNEDKIGEASTEFEQFQKNRLDRQYSEEEEGPAPVQSERPPRHFRGTSFFLGLCILVYLLNLMQTISLSKEGAPEMAMTPIQTALIYDAPEENGPFWRGGYTWLLLKIKGADTTLAEGPLFVKIGQGELWRLFSPAILHAELLHILFNMLWLWMLGRQIEQRIGTLRYIALTIILGVVTNTAQYLMSGPFFLGYSGIVLGLAGFIWAREKIAPWEGYPLQRSVILFLTIFVLAMFALQFGSFLLILFSDTTFTPNIANTAHIAGALLGMLLARLPFFEARRTAP